MARKLTNEEERQARGDCYRAAMLYALAHAKKNMMVVHGSLVPPRGVWTSSRGGERAYDVEFDHAWIEVGNKLFDPSFTDNPKPIDKEKYYKEFNVNEAKLKKYSVDEANMKSLINHHYGPWED